MTFRSDPMPAFLADVKVEQKVVSFGPLKGQLRWFVCKAGVPMGSMFEFFQPGALKVPYPFRQELGFHNGFQTEDEANQKFSELQAHVACVLKLPVNQRPGSAKGWT
jgi:hypothetical protein